MQTKRSYFFAGALGGGAENIKRTKKHLAHGTEKNQIPFGFCTPFLKLPPEKFLFGRKSNFSDAFLEKGEQKSSGFFSEDALVPGAR